MANDRPFPSLTGTGDWEWNRWQEHQRRRQAPTGASKSHRSRGKRTASVQSCEELRAEVKRQKLRNQYIIDHYEALWTKKESRHSKDKQPTGTYPETETILAKLLRLFDR